MIRWTFYLDGLTAEGKDANIQTVSSETEDERIKRSVEENPDGLLCLPSEYETVYIPMKKVKCIIRNVIPDNLELPKEDAEQIGEEHSCIP